MQDCLRGRVPTNVERFIYMGNNNKAPVEAIGLFRLQLESSCYLDLDETWTNLVTLVHLEMEKLVFFNIQI